MFRRLAAVCALSFFSITLNVQAEEALGGFTLGGEPINPVCIGKMQPWISDRGIIIKSIVLETCQKSNFGFHKKRVNVADGNVSAELEGGPFGYKVVGETDSGLFILQQSENVIGAYRIEEQEVKPDLFKPDVEKVHVLTSVANSFVPCLKKLAVKGDAVLVEKHVYDPKAPHAQQCGEKRESAEYKLN